MTDALAAIRAEKAFVKLPPADRKRVFATLSETRRCIKAERQSDRYIDRALRLRHRNALKSHLTWTLQILEDDVGGFDAMDWLTDHHHQGDMTAAMIELKTFRATAQALLEGAMAFEPDVGRKGRGEMQLDAELTGGRSTRSSKPSRALASRSAPLRASAVAQARACSPSSSPMRSGSRSV